MAEKKYGNPRSTYRHGNLKEALLKAGLDMAREHGPEGVVLREATRRAGVAFNAAYRHYKGQPDLLDAVRAAALARVARTMEAELSALGPIGPSPPMRDKVCGPSAKAIYASPVKNPACFAPLLYCPLHRISAVVTPTPAKAALIHLNCWAWHSTVCWRPTSLLPRSGHTPSF